MFINVQFKIGSAKYNDEIISDIAISRKHCIFRCEDNKWKLEDLSTSVTLINNIAVPSGIMQDVSPGDVIQFSPNVKFKYIFNFAQRIKKVCTSERTLDHICYQTKNICRESNVKEKKSKIIKVKQRSRTC